MSEIQQSLELLGFNSAEASVYIALVKEGAQNGSQIARAIGLNRASAYGALEALYKRGAIQLLPGSTAVYVAPDPKNYLNTVSRTLSEAALRAAATLSSLSKEFDTAQFMNIKGKPVHEKERELIEAAQEEILLNVAPNWDHMKPWLAAAAKRGVRIIVFTFTDLSPADFTCELYRGHLTDECYYQRHMVVTDMQHALMAEGPLSGELSGTWSSNRLFVSVIAEHIHHDIYLYKIEKKQGVTPVTPDIQINSLLETGRMTLNAKVQA